jgi:hypothetical protein
MDCDRRCGRMAGPASRPAMRTSLILTALLVPVAAHAAGLEVELAPGAALSNDSAEWAPSLRGRVGLELGVLTPSLVVFGTPTSAPPSISHEHQQGGLQAWGAAVELRVHNQGEHQVHAGLGVGWGSLVATQAQEGDYAGYRGHAAPYVEAVTGYRYVREPFRIGIDATLHVFNRVDFISDVGAGPTDRMSIGSSWLLGFALSVAWRALSF